MAGLSVQFQLWKRANVSPIYKKGDRQLKENYRPMSLVSCLGKIMEWVICNELYEYCSFTVNNLLTSKNSAFKKNDSTVNQLLDLTTKIYQSLGDGSDVLMVFLDVTKAFDKVYHK